MELNNRQFLKPLVLPAALNQFEYQATAICCIRGIWRFKHKTKKDVKKTPARIPSTLSKHCMCNTVSIFVAMSKFES